jgi:hypothetical protein
MEKVNIRIKKAPGTKDIHLVNTSECCHIQTNKFKDMHLSEFINNYSGLLVKYPYANDFRRYRIKLKEDGCPITCEMENNICVKAYIDEKN